MAVFKNWQTGLPTLTHWPWDSRNWHFSHALTPHVHFQMQWSNCTSICNWSFWNCWFCPHHFFKALFVKNALKNSLHQEMWTTTECSEKSVIIYTDRKRSIALQLRFVWTIRKIWRMKKYLIINKYESINK